MKEMNSTERFSDRVSDYVKYRPSYPQSLLDYLDKRVQLKGKSVADIGAGTGIFSRLLVERGAKVIAVEPNAKMRTEAEGPGVELCSGTAEATGLPEHTIEFITCAQAFHWFDPSKTRQEFLRILKPGALVALIWNDMDRTTPAGAEYDRIRHEFGGQLYQDIVANEAKLPLSMTTLFGGAYESHVFSFTQNLSHEGIAGRYFSSSYSPKADSPDKPKAAEKVAALFNKYEEAGLVRLDYKTELFLGPLN